MMILYHILLFLLANLVTLNNALCNRQTLSSYRLIGSNIAFDSEATKMIYKETGRYIPKNIVSTRMQFQNQKLFIVQPRYRSGVPITLGLVNLQNKCKLVMEPYPSWILQHERNKDSIHSAIDLYLDQNRVLWVLDAGVTNTLETPVTTFKPKVLSISTVTNRITKTIDLSPFVTNTSDLQYIVTEHLTNGDDYIYISDAGGKALIVFNVNLGRGRRLILPDAITSQCNSTNALYLAMLKKQNNHYLYFTYLDCSAIYSVPTTSLGIDESESSIELVGRSSVPIVFLGTDGNSKLYFRQKQQSDVYEWDSNKPFPSKGWETVYFGQDERIGTHVTTGICNQPWILETNILDFINNSTGCPGASSKISPITNNLVY